MKKVFLCSIALCLSVLVFAQRHASILKSEAPLTWLGLDFSQASFTGSSGQYGDIGEVTDDQVLEKYIPAWNLLFVNEEKKYDVAKYLDRGAVTYALDVTTKANNKNYPSTIFSDDPGRFQHLNKSDVGRLVGKYNFLDHKGTGVLFFIEGMSKGKEMVSAWVVFVDMDTKTVLQSAQITGRAGGIGFRNYWAKGYLNILKDVSSRMR